MRILNPNLALSQASVDEVINVSQNSEQLVPDSPEEEGDKGSKRYLHVSLCDALSKSPIM
jgi:hypothetical protein